MGPDKTKTPREGDPNRVSGGVIVSSTGNKDSPLSGPVNRNSSNSPENFISTLRLYHPLGYQIYTSCGSSVSSVLAGILGVGVPGTVGKMRSLLPITRGWDAVPEDPRTVYYHLF